MVFTPDKKDHKKAMADIRRIARRIKNNPTSHHAYRRLRRKIVAMIKEEIIND